ncbi:unnamed protein product, partial [Ranitomeya imitator]
METLHNLFKSEDLLSNMTRLSFVDHCLLNLLWSCSSDALKDFFSKIISFSMDVLKSRFTKNSETAFDTQLTKKIGYYKMLEVLYLRLSKDEIYSKESRINHAFEGTVNVDEKLLTKTLLKSCYDAYTENMSGETQLLEKRRPYHCAAYNCAIAIGSCTFTESKFYHGFLFTEKKEKSFGKFKKVNFFSLIYTLQGRGLASDVSGRSASGAPPLRPCIYPEDKVSVRADNCVSEGGYRRSAPTCEADMVRKRQQDAKAGAVTLNQDGADSVERAERADAANASYAKRLEVAAKLEKYAWVDGAG